MKVILLKDVKGQGKKDEIIDVSDGYANNFLIKNKLAVPCTKTSKEVLDKELKNRKIEEEQLIASCTVLANEIKRKKLIFFLKAGKDGKTFGTISTKQIHDELKRLGYQVDKKSIHLNYALDTLGVHKVEIELHKKVKFELDIHIKTKN